MIETLDVLRDQIDKIDQDILKLLSKRLSLVAKVGDIKSYFGLFIYAPEREEMIVSCKRREAITLGVSPDLIEDVLRRIMRESYYSENEKGFQKLSPNFRPIVIVGGYGQMGQFFMKMLTLSGYTVRVLDQDDWVRAESILSDVGVVFISVPIHVVKSVVNKLPRLSHDCIVVDLSSIKETSLKAILDVHTGPVLGLHPMFSPDTGNMIKQIVIYCEGRYPEMYQWLLQQVRLWGAKIYSCNPIEHDKYMSFIQGLCHLITFTIGYHLLKEKINLKTIISFASPIFRLELIKLGRLFKQNPHLYADIIMESTHNIAVMKRYYKRLGKILTLLEQNNKQEFIKQFNKIRHWLGIYSDIFFQDSRKILQYISDLKKSQ